VSVHLLPGMNMVEVGGASEQIVCIGSSEAPIGEVIQFRARQSMALIPCRRKCGQLEAGSHRSVHARPTSSSKFVVFMAPNVEHDDVGLLALFIPAFNVGC
jgi:hypothetical protein